ncbi:hypothetical protein [Ehrlichia canis]|uniref:hypothetical protein n=1 Tax=Ehrlichia canis TaxID=944 RepID=UPI001F26566A|nr:hypothetical protein [Ehrlichia canis]UKC53169.1 hypothetical protein s20019040002_000212 [Ehrlichia canis]UKC54106.1 hypothetical protein s20026770001_000212 [Ehrlichia canis]UKC55042.1 hypothetical protein s21009500007_000212 [Ehrlichia canis]
MLGKDYFSDLDKRLVAFAKLNNGKQRSSKYHFMLSSCILITAIITVLSLIVLYSDKQYFSSMFKGGFKLFSSDTIPFSMALIAIIPSLLLLFFLIYKVCAFHDLNRKLNNESIDILGKLEEWQYFLHLQLEYNTNKIENIDEVLKLFKKKYSSFVKQCSDGFAKLEEQCKSVLAAVNSTTHGVNAGISKINCVVEDVKLQLNGLSAGCQKFSESSSNLLSAIESAIKTEGANVDDRIAFLQNLQANLASDVDLGLIQNRVQNFVARVRSILVEKPSIVKPAVLRELWCLQESFSVIIMKVHKTDQCALEFLQLIQNLEQEISKFSLSASKKIASYNGNNRNLLEKMIKLELPLLHINILRFLTAKRAAFITNTSADITQFIQEYASGDLQRLSDSTSDSMLSIGPFLSLQDTNVSDKVSNDINPQ